MELILLHDVADVTGTDAERLGGNDGVLRRDERVPAVVPLAREHEQARLVRHAPFMTDADLDTIDAEVRLYDRLFTVPEPDAGGDFKAHLNPHSLEVITAKLEPSLAAAKPEERYQFERLAYCALDKDSTPAKPVFNRTITLKDAWAKEAQKG